ncbi:MAG: TIGR04086 family membrane protein [bacterium]|nr:TIGR04086 family membrane protein [bacterium]
MKERFDFKYTRDELGREVHKYRWSILLLILLFLYIFNDQQIYTMFKQSIPLYNDGKFFEYIVPVILFVLLVVFVLLVNYIFNWFEIKSEVPFFQKFGFLSKLILDSLLTSFFYFIFSYFFLLIILSVLDYYIFGTKLHFSPVLTLIFLFLTPLGISTFILMRIMKKTGWLWGLIFGIVLFGISQSLPNLIIFQGFVFEIQYLNLLLFMGLGSGCAALWQMLLDRQQHVTGYDFETTPGNR